jgi:hypothetical protein
MAEKEKEVEKGLIVVEELPTQSLREVKADDGKVYECRTRDEALSEILELLRKIDKKL